MTLQTVVRQSPTYIFEHTLAVTVPRAPCPEAHLDEYTLPTVMYPFPPYGVACMPKPTLLIT